MNSPAVSKLQMLMQVIFIRDFLDHHVSLPAAGTTFLRVLSEVPTWSGSGGSFLPPDQRSRVLCLVRAELASVRDSAR